MEINSFIASHLQAHLKKLIIICTATVSIYLIKRYMDKKKRALEKKDKKKIKDFPTIEEIQRFIEELPFDAVVSGKAVTLKDLLGELSEFSEDEDWKELIASVHHMYRDSPAVNKEANDDTGSLMSIYEDPTVITLAGATTTTKPPDTSPECIISILDTSHEAKEIDSEGNTRATSSISPSEKPKVTQLNLVGQDSERSDENEIRQLIK